VFRLPKDVLKIANNFCLSFQFIVALVCVGAVVSANPWGHNDDGQWRGEGLAESQDHGQWSNGWGVAAHGALGVYGVHAYGVPSVHGVHGTWAHGPAPLAHDGVVVDTPEVAHAKIAHASAVARLSHGIAGSHGVYGGLAHGVYGIPSIHGVYGAWAHGAAPLGHNGVVVDTPEVAHAKAAHLSAVAAASHGAHGAHGHWW